MSELKAVWDQVFIVIGHSYMILKKKNTSNFFHAIICQQALLRLLLFFLSHLCSVSITHQRPMLLMYHNNTMAAEEFHLYKFHGALTQCAASL